MEERKQCGECASTCEWMRHMRASERERTTEEHVAMLSRRLRIPMEQARELLSPEGETDSTSESISSDSEPDRPHTPGGVRPLNLGGEKSQYIGGIHTGDLRMDTANRLRWLRNHSGMLREVILNNLGVSKDTLDMWEGGQAAPSRTQLIILAELYNVRVADIIKE